MDRTSVRWRIAFGCFENVDRTRFGGSKQRGCFYESEFLQHRWTKDDACVYANGSSNDGRKVEVLNVEQIERQGKLLENSGRE